MLIHMTYMFTCSVSSADTMLRILLLSCQRDIRYKVLWIGEICKHKGIGETKVLQGKNKAKVLHIYWLPYSVLLAVLD